MFDSPFDDWTPGKPTLFGWPWHGRIDLAATGDEYPQITLANGSVITLPSPNLTLVQADFQTGNLLRFRDPRAADPIRAEEQLAADAALGIQWRADVAYSPVLSLIHGRRVAFSGSSGECWIYHGNGQNYLVNPNISLGYVMLQKMSVIRRLMPGDTDIVETEFVPGTLPDGEYIDGFGTEVVMSATPDGSKAIIAGMINEVGPGSTHIEGSQYSGGWLDSPYQFAEVQLSTDEDGVHTAIIRKLRTPEQTAGTILVQEPSLGRKRFGWGVEWIEDGEVIGPGGNGYYKYISSPLFAEGESYGAGYAIEPFGDYSLRNGFEDRIVGMYYNEAGEAIEMTADCVTQSDRTETYTGSASGTEESIMRSGPGTAASIVIADGDLEITLAASRTVSQTTTMTLKNNGVVVGISEFESTATANINGVLTYQLNYDSSGYLTTLEDVGGGSSTYTNKATVDGVVKFSKNYNDSTDTGFTGGFSGLYPGIPGVDYSKRSWVKTQNMKPGTVVETPTTVWLSTVRYCALMPAAALFTFDADSDARQFWVGGGCTPDGSLPGSFDRAGRLQWIFGSWNPVTGEVIRDAPNPVCFV